ncbi:hypothetical protein [Vibrio parahaemolyticus]|uniref:hypothetical protein n=1 Tax=Vibrio parahaemolyticus TaxID=670 RepID=UPI0023628CB0|nr:hypothetical protein [Vibrio parahaemolyticus]HCH5091126.1 hypothetical protein [Vibrio parahaemolyticus]
MSLKPIDKLYKDLNKQSRRKGKSVGLEIDFEAEAISSHIDIFVNVVDIHRIKNNNGMYESIDVNNAVCKAIPKVEQEIKKLVDKYPRYHWKYLIARLPKSVLQGNLETTYTFGAHLLESCTSFSTRDIDENELYKDGNYVIISPTAEVQKDFACLLGYACALRQLYVILRTSSKGVDYQLTVESPFPERIEVDSIIRAIELYDKRNEVGFNSYAPTKSGFSLEQFKFKHKSDIVIVSSINSSPYQDYIPKSLKKPKNKKYTMINYSIYPFDLNTIYENFAKEKVDFPWPDEVLEIIVIIKFSSWCLKKGWVFAPDICENGYYLLIKDFVINALGQVVLELNQEFSERFGVEVTISGQDLVEKYMKPVRNEMYPGNAALFFDAGKMIGVDMVSVLPVLMSVMEYTSKQGNVANYRGNFFEVQTQNMIDNSIFKPDENIHLFIGKHLKLSQRTITDFDAILVKDNVLVAVSCKSMLQGDAYDKGDYKSIRNAKTSLEKYVREWRDKVSIINSNKVGDNYDFSGFDEVIGIVLTPNVFYVDVDYHSETKLTGLFESMSTTELASWLNEI